MTARQALELAGQMEGGAWRLRLWLDGLRGGGASSRYLGRWVLVAGAGCWETHPPAARHEPAKPQPTVNSCSTFQLPAQWRSWRPCRRPCPGYAPPCLPPRRSPCQKPDRALHQPLAAPLALSIPSLVNRSIAVASISSLFLFLRPRSKSFNLHLTTNPKLQSHSQHHCRFFESFRSPH